jgi:type IV pilus assembly protein PilQ
MRLTVKDNKSLFIRGRKLLKSLGVFFLFLILFSSFNYANPVFAQVKQEITAIELSDHTITIKAEGALPYKIQKGSDPFIVMLDLEGVSLGRFNQKIFSKSKGITEIRPTQITSPVLASRLEILLNNPSDITAEKKEGALVLKIKEEQIPLKEIVSSSRNAGSIIAVKFDKMADSVELVIKGDGIMPEPVVKESEEEVIIDIPNVKMTASLPLQAPPPVKNITTHKTEKDGLRFILAIEGNADVTYFTLDDEFIVDIPYKAINAQKTEIAKKDNSVPTQTAKPATPTQAPPTVRNTQPATSKVISLDFQDADVTAILKLLSDVSGYNIIIHPDVKGKITMKLLNVSWEEALEVILKTFLLEKVMYGNIIRVIPMKALQDEMKAIADLKEATKRTEDQHTRVFTANYASVEQFKDAIEKSKFLTKDLGSITIDSRTRSITVKDTARVLDEVAKVLENIDKPTRQVLIESRILELNNITARSLGVEWGLAMRPFNWESAITGGLPNPVLGGLGSPGLISLPASATGISDPTSALTVGYLNRKQTLGLDIRLTAIERLGKARIISKPKVITGDNQKAKIVQGESIPYGEREVSGGVATITTRFKDVAVTIEVVPQVTSDNNILMNVMINKEDLVEFVDIGGGTLAPRTSKLEARTNLMVENGETMVIGGIYKRDEKDIEQRVPGIASIPLVGELFKRTTKEDDIKEYLIFLTPKVIQR